MDFNREKIKTLMPWLASGIRWGKNRKNELSALKRHLHRKQLQIRNRKTSDSKIVVVFICQYIPAWSKNKQLYEVLCNDSRFETYLLCIPNRVSNHEIQHPEDLSNEVYDYFLKNGYNCVINAIVGENKWFNLESLHPDYVFYNRYDRPMPLPYTSTSVSAYAKVCLIVYGCALLRIEERMIDKAFAANTFCFFAESDGIRKVFYQWNTILCKLRLSNAVCCGIPAVENAYKAKDDISRSWLFSKNDFRVIYAPRWTMDSAWGGSSFLKYKDTFIRIADMYSNIDILVRPHPLMFDHFVNSGIMTKNDVENFNQSCKERNNIRIDGEKEYHATFWNSSVLVCDYSSMIIEYFCCAKPIIYLTYKEDIEYTDQMKLMLECSYIVNTEDELIKTIEQLANGNDPLAVKRNEICNKFFLNDVNLHASANMKQLLIDKCYS